MIILMIIIGMLFIYLEQEIFSTSFYHLKTDKLVLKKGPIRILHLSDLHSKSFGYNNKRLIKKIKKLNPDLIVTTGDMVSSTDTNGDPFLQVVTACVKDYPIFYVEGNHELTAKYDQLNQQSHWYDQYINTLSELGVYVLNNECKKVSIEGDELILCGLAVPLSHYYSVPPHIQKYNHVARLDKISDVLPELNQKKFNVLLAHNPFLAPMYQSHGFDQVYCGHVHGGAIRLPITGGILSPGGKFFPKYSAGVYTLGQMKMIVSRGLGRLRLFNRPHVVVVEISRQ